MGSALASVTVSSDNNKRSLLAAEGLALFLDRPEGVGALQFRTVSAELGLTERGRPLENLHNAYVNVAVELGALGLLSYLLWLARTARDLTSEWRRRRRETFPLVVGLTAAFVGFAFQALTIVQYRVQAIFAVAFVLAGMAAAAHSWSPQTKPRAASSSRSPRPAQAQTWPAPRRPADAP